MADHVETVTSGKGGYYAGCSCGELHEGPFETPGEARAHADVHAGNYDSLDEAQAVHRAADEQVKAEAEARAAEKAAEEAQAAQVEQSRLDVVEQQVADLQAKLDEAGYHEGP